MNKFTNTFYSAYLYKEEIVFEKKSRKGISKKENDYD